MKHIILNCILSFSFLILFACNTTYMASYDIGLTKVESPANAKEQFGETKVVCFKDDNFNKYQYEDDFINIIWYVSPQKFHFDLINKSEHSIKINWDDVSYVDYKGNTGKIMHSGVKYIDRNNSQPATTVPKGAKLSDIILPTENVYFSSGLYGSWCLNNLLPSFYKSKESLNENAQSYIGKTMTVLMPIIIQNIQNDYTFVFRVDNLIQEKK